MNATAGSRPDRYVFTRSAGIALAAFAASFAIFLTGMPEPVAAQAIDPQRDCQTIRNCRFEKGGSFRGCISSYSCRSCRFEPANCRIAGAKGTCRRQVCYWR